MTKQYFAQFMIGKSLFHPNSIYKNFKMLLGDTSALCGATDSLFRISGDD